MSLECPVLTACVGFRFLVPVGLGTATRQWTLSHKCSKASPILFFFSLLLCIIPNANQRTNTGEAWEQAYIGCTYRNSLVVAEDASLEHTPLLFPWPAAVSLVEVTRVRLPLLKLYFLLCKQFRLLSFVLPKEGGLTNQRSLFLLALFATLHVLSDLPHGLHRRLHSLIKLHHEVVNTFIDGSITDITLFFRLLLKLNNKYHNYLKCMYFNCVLVIKCTDSTTTS